MRRFTVEVSSTVVIDVTDEGTVFTRVTENHDSEGVPQPRVPHGDGWRDTFYDLDGENGVIEMFAYNAAANGVHRVSQLDGWGDVDLTAVTMNVTGVEVGHWVEEEIELPTS